MSSYLIKKDPNIKEITYMVYDIDGFEFKPRNTTQKSIIKVNSVIIYEPEMIDKLLSLKFQKKFNKLSDIIIHLLYDETEADEGDMMIVMDEVARLKSIVEFKYQRFLEVKEYNDYIHKLDFLDKQIRQKIAIMNYQNSYIEEENLGRGR